MHQHGLKVVLTGEGADEFFGGYDIFKEAAVRRFWARQPESAMRPTLLRRLYPDIAGLGQTSNAFLSAFFSKGLADTDAFDYSHRIRWTNAARFRRSFLAVEPTARRRRRLPPAFASWPALAQAQYLEIATFLSPYLLSSQGDRVAMAHAVEGRFPFLDYRVVAFANRLPADEKLLGLSEKWLLRQLGRKSPAGRNLGRGASARIAPRSSAASSRTGAGTTSPSCCRSARSRPASCSIRRRSLSWRARPRTRRAWARSRR